MACYTPYPVEEAAEAIGFHRNRVPLGTLIGGLMGLAAMFSFLVDPFLAVFLSRAASLIGACMRFLTTS